MDDKQNMNNFASFQADENMEDDELDENFDDGELDEEFATEESFTDDSDAEELVTDARYNTIDDTEFDSTNADEFKLDSFAEFADKNPTNAATTTAANFGNLNIDTQNLSFRIACEIGQVSISLADLMQLKIGDSIEFMRWPHKVKLKLNDYLFAEGYLVEIHGMLGVKITDKLVNAGHLVNSENN